jgi:hypothetical protein
MGETSPKPSPGPRLARLLAVAAGAVVPLGLAAPADAGAAPARVRISTACFEATGPDGSRASLYGQRFTTGAPTRSTPAIVLVHGVASDTRIWDAVPNWSVARRLARAGYVVIAYDRLGYRRSAYAGAGGGDALTVGPSRPCSTTSSGSCAAAPTASARPPGPAAARGPPAARPTPAGAWRSSVTPPAGSSCRATPGATTTSSPWSRPTPERRALRGPARQRGARVGRRAAGRRCLRGALRADRRRLDGRQAAPAAGTHRLPLRRPDAHRLRGLQLLAAWRGQGGGHRLLRPGRGHRDAGGRDRLLRRPGAQTATPASSGGRAASPSCSRAPTTTGSCPRTPTRSSSPRGRRPAAAPSRSSCSRTRATRSWATGRSRAGPPRWSGGSAATASGRTSERRPRREPAVCGRPAGLVAPPLSQPTVSFWATPLEVFLPLTACSVSL